MSLTWEKFNKKHTDSGRTVEVDGKKMYEWNCSCGATKLLRLNSGIPLGLKIQWQNHYTEIMNSKKPR